MQVRRVPFSVTLLQARPQGPGWCAELHVQAEADGHMLVLWAVPVEMLASGALHPGLQAALQAGDGSLAHPVPIMRSRRAVAHVLPGLLTIDRAGSAFVRGSGFDHVLARDGSEIDLVVVLCNAAGAIAGDADMIVTARVVQQANAVKVQLVNKLICTNGRLFLLEHLFEASMEDDGTVLCAVCLAAESTGTRYTRAWP